MEYLHKGHRLSYSVRVTFLRLNLSILIRNNVLLYIYVVIINGHFTRHLNCLTRRLNCVDMVTCASGPNVNVFMNRPITRSNSNAVMNVAIATRYNRPIRMAYRKSMIVFRGAFIARRSVGNPKSGRSNVTPNNVSMSPRITRKYRIKMNPIIILAITGVTRPFIMRNANVNVMANYANRCLHINHPARAFIAL